MKLPKICCCYPKKLHSNIHLLTSTVSQGTTINVCVILFSDTASTVCTTSRSLAHIAGWPVLQLLLESIQMSARR